MKELFYLDHDFVKLYNAVADVVNFCWDDKGWIGTETIRKSGKFLELMVSLSQAVQPFEPQMLVEEDGLE